MTLQKTFIEWVSDAQNYESKFKKILGDLVKFPTIAYREPEAIQECANELEGILKSFGYNAKQCPTAPEMPPVIFAEKNVKAKKTLLFYHHYDVQPEIPLDLWESSPWKLTERNNRLYARGTADDKGEFVFSLLSIQLLEDKLGDSPINVKFVLEGEEEAGSNNLAKFTTKNPSLLKANGCIWEGAMLTPSNNEKIAFDTPVDLICGLKGNAYFDFKTVGPPKFPRTDVHSGSAALTANAAWRLVWALSTLKDENENILIEGINELVQEPEKEDLEALSKQGNENEVIFKQDYQLENTLLGKTGLELLVELYLKPSLTICGLNSGFQSRGSKTIVPAEASAKVDFRLVPNLTMKKAEELLKKHLLKHGFDDIEVSLITGYDPAKTPISDPFIQNLRKVSDEITAPKTSIITPVAAGSGPAYLFTPHTPICFIGNNVEGLNGHAPNENIPIRSIKSSIVYNAIIAMEMAK
ncbi:MAG: M20/M25/M40 family metallo-hydrolase [Candidatus Heimdallarchaeota archaeon]|nr:M20/M25/M40 family metallo-hydrolase [Candidatus Heimdallarchaeota archaeon]